MAKPTLCREVEVPRPRTSGAAVVIVAALAMFTAVAASAFAIRVRMLRDGGFVGCPHRVSQAATAPVISVTSDGEPAVASDLVLDPAKLDPFEAELFATFAAAADAGDDEAALAAYELLPESSVVRDAMAVRREEVARRYLDAQLERLGDEIAGNQCAAAKERVERLARLLPDTRIDTARCN